MKKLFLLILVFISVQSFGQLKLYAERKNTDNTIDSFYIKQFPQDSVFNKEGVFVSLPVEVYNKLNLETPGAFANYTLSADGIYRNYVPFSQNTERVRWDSIVGKPNTTAFLSNSTNKNLVTDAQLTVIGNTSGTNTGDNATNTQYSGLEASKQDALVSGTNIKTINGTTVLGSGNIATATLTGSEAITNKTLGAFNVGLDAGANDSYVVTLSPAPAAYTTGMIVIFRANTQNTTGCTINVNGLGVVNIVKRVSTTLATGDILAQMFCMLVYNGSAFVILNPVVN